jgi:hypothetical protein
MTGMREFDIRSDCRRYTRQIALGIARDWDPIGDPANAPGAFDEYFS